MDNKDSVRNTSVYDLPKEWIRKIKETHIPVSKYIKLALKEKLEKDKLI